MGAGTRVRTAESEEEACEDLSDQGQTAFLMDWRWGVSRKGRFKNDLHMVS